MFPNLNPKKMQALMKQMGISEDEVSASRVVIEKENGSSIIIENPSVKKINMQGQTSFQVVGEEREEVGINEADIKTVVDKTGCSEEKAREILEKNSGDLAESILELSS